MSKLHLEVLEDDKIEYIEEMNNKIFDEYERLPIELLKFLCKRKDVDTFLIKNESATIGFCTLSWTDEILFVIYFAIMEEFRNMGYGSEVIKLFEEKKNELAPNGVILLDCHDGDTDINKRRINFYKRNGFNEIHKRTIAEPYNYIWLYSADMTLEEARNIFENNTDYLFSRDVWLRMPTVEDY